MFERGSRLVLPETPEKLAMPAQHGIRLYNDQSLFPRAQLTGQENDEQSVAPSESWAFTLPFENDKLLTKQSVFQHQLRLGRERSKATLKNKEWLSGFVHWRSHGLTARSRDGALSRTEFIVCLSGQD